jgi:hypothetical protein
MVSAVALTAALSSAGRGKARQGWAGLGVARHGAARQGRAWNANQKERQMSKDFKPIRADGRSYRIVAVEHLKDKSPGTIVPYQELGAALELDPETELTKIQVSVRAANMTLLKRHSRGVENVTNVGYRILYAREHMVVAHSRETKAETQMRMSVAFFDGANLEEMTDHERREHNEHAMLSHQLFAMHSYNKSRFDRLEALFRGPVVDQKS